MSGVALYPDDVSEVPGDAQTRALPVTCEVVLAELCTALFASLPRRDQRRKGKEYVRGLLGAEGRKTVRNIATRIGGQATEQGLHHFVSSSTWDWTPVRQALAQYLMGAAPPQAWVVRPMVIPKAGENSVGVEKCFFPSLGQSLNAQQAVGVWAAGPGRSHPVNWRLRLSPAWLDDRARRHRASIPDSVVPESLGDCAAEAYLSMTHRWGLPVRPVVLDAPGIDAADAFRRFRAAGVPLLLRVGGAVPLTVADPALPERGGTLPAHQIMSLARNMRRPMRYQNGEQRADARTVLAAAARVRTPPRRGLTGRDDQPGELLLLGTGEQGGRWPAAAWLTDLNRASPASLLRLTGLVHRVDRDFAGIADRVGVRDYSGRSYAGWHRHITLASAAHAVAALTGR